MLERLKSLWAGIDKGVIVVIVSVLLAIVAAYYKGYDTGYKTGYKEGFEAKQVNPVVKTEYVDKVKTEIVYVPKEPGEKTDVDVTIPKQQLNVKVNGKEYTINKADNESQIFDKNKLTLTQETTATIAVEVPTIDKTRKWGIGIGASKNGLVGALEFPLKANVGGWAIGSSKEAAAGIMIKF